MFSAQKRGTAESLTPPLRPAPIHLPLPLQNLSERGYVKRMAADTFSAQKRGTAGKSGGKLKADDAMARFVVCRTHDTVLFFRSQAQGGRCHGAFCGVPHE
ncbi:unnamed protein product [Closterium sp. NIES-54]